MLWTAINTVVILVTLVVLCLVMYSKKVQRSEKYQATVVPLANIMDVGFLAMTPIIVLLLGVDSPIFMLLLVLTGALVGVVMSYNMKYFEPLLGTDDPLGRISSFSRWALLAASVANIAYYIKLMSALVFLPFGVQSQQLFSLAAAAVLVALGVIGYLFGLGKLNALGEKTTAFNIAAVLAILAGFIVFNVQMFVTGEWVIPEYNPPNDPDRLRKLFGFFAIVQGFEASRYMRNRFPDASFRISTMRTAQLVSGVVFVLLIASTLIAFAVVRPELRPVAIIQIGEVVTPMLPFLILVAAITSQLSAGVNALSSRSDLLVEATDKKLNRKYTYPIIVAPCVALVMLADVTQAIAVASRIFAGYFLLQALIAMSLAFRKRHWGELLLFGVAGFAMALVMIFGLSV
ncbi:hypothetical protein FIV42_24740 [Persicimonas caeni]|uniref:Uncharacterized protein n=1 Tax=Persicimonas caeni TaxID=2292766 RepID=A0A4Y6Q1H2_PERCE|nr:hypothetical protein [Persicimonas caeni]QDG53835.1 hypothetical protein FIV42_24740 [Persicimonas caeni]QED35056.1 hypothetical protein FRD00_24735 [Persicimonas caeni]